MSTKISLTKFEKYQQSTFDGKVGQKKIYLLGTRQNRNHDIKAKEIIAFLQSKNIEKILEIGVGAGNHAFKVLENTPVHYTGIDISLESLLLANEKLKSFNGRYTLVQDNANRLSFNNNVFDATFCTATLHHIQKPAKMINEMARVLKTYGKIAIMEPNWIYPTNILFAIFFKSDRNMLLMRKNFLIKLLRESGFQNVKVKNLIFTPPVPKGLIPIYDRIDRVCSNIPFIRKCSIMLFASGTKRN